MQKAKSKKKWERQRRNSKTNKNKHRNEIVQDSLTKVDNENYPLFCVIRESELFDATCFGNC